MASLLKRIGEGLVSFGSGIPQAEIDRIRADRDVAQQNVEIGQQQIDANERAIKAQSQQEIEAQRQQQLRAAAAQGDANAITQLVGESPKDAIQLLKASGIQNQQQLDSAERFTDEALASTPEQIDNVIRRRITEVVDRRGIPTQSSSLLELPFDEKVSALNAMKASFGSVKGSVPFELATFEGLTEGLTEDQKNEALQIKLGLKPRAGSSSVERIAESDELTNKVADSQQTIAERRKFGLQTGASRAKTIDSAFSSIETANQNIRNMDRAITELEGGASTGAIESRFFPTFRESTVRLEQIQKELGLDVIGGVTFGALSKGELDLALAVALPTGLQPPELIEYLNSRKEAKNKLIDYYSEQIDFLDQGGTVAGFLRSKNRSGSSGDNQTKLMQQAEEAIQQGADRNAVIQRLNDAGVDTSGL